MADQKAAGRIDPLLAETASSVRCQTAATHGGRPDKTPVRPTTTTLDFRLLGNLEGVIHLDAQVSHGRLELRMSEE